MAQKRLCSFALAVPASGLESSPKHRREKIRSSVRRDGGPVLGRLLRRAFQDAPRAPGILLSGLNNFYPLSPENSIGRAVRIRALVETKLIFVACGRVLDGLIEKN